MGQSGWSSAVQFARALEKAERDRIREQDRQLKAQQRAAREGEKNDRKTHLEWRAKCADELNRSLEQRLAALGDILKTALRQTSGLDWAALERHVDQRQLQQDAVQILLPSHGSLTWAKSCSQSFTSSLSCGASGS